MARLRFGRDPNPWCRAIRSVS